MFFQDAIPNTSSYMIAGYTIFFIVMAIYLISFLVRTRNLKQDMSMLESMKPESKVTAGKVTAGKATKAKTSRPKASSPKTKKKK